MKRIISMLIALTMLFVLISTNALFLTAKITDPAYIDLRGEKSKNTIIGFSGGIGAKTNPDYVEIDLGTGAQVLTDPFMFINTKSAGNVSVQDHLYIAMRIKTNFAGTTLNYQYRIKTSNNNEYWSWYTAGVGNSEEWQTLVCNWSTAYEIKALSGMYNEIRLDFFNAEDDKLDIPSGAYMYIESIAFFSSKAEAEAYTGMASAKAPSVTYPEFLDLRGEQGLSYVGGYFGGVSGEAAADYVSIKFNGASNVCSDAYFTISANSIIATACDHQYIAIRFKTNLSGFKYQYRLYATGDARGYFPWSPVIAAADTQDWQTGVYDWSEAVGMPVLSGTFAGVRLDVMNNDNDTVTYTDDSYLYIESIAFFNTEAEAKAYTGIANAASVIADRKTNAGMTPIYKYDLNSQQLIDTVSGSFNQVTAELTVGENGKSAIKFSPTVDNADTYFILPDIGMNGSSAQYAVIKYRSTAKIYGEFFWNNLVTGWGAENHALFAWNKTNEWDHQIVYLGDKFSNDISAFRLDPLQGDMLKTDHIEIEYVYLFDSIYAANNFIENEIDPPPTGDSSVSVFFVLALIFALGAIFMIVKNRKINNI